MVTEFSEWLKDASAAEGPPKLLPTKEKATAVGDNSTLPIVFCVRSTEYTCECRVAVSASQLLSIHALYRSCSWACISASLFAASKAGCSAG